MSDDQYTDRPIADSGEDEFGFEDYRKSLVRVIRDAGTPITIGIFGTWGSGKTSLMRIVEKDLQEEYHAKTVWFDAWKYDKEDVLWRALLLSVLEALRPQPHEEGKEISEEDKELDQKLDDLQDSLYRDVDREEAGSVEIDWHEAAKGTIKLGLSFLPLLSVLQEPLKQLGGTGAPKGAIDNLVKTFRRERIKIHRDRIQFLDQFQEKFSTLVTDQIQEKGRLVVFIDDLDRCLPEKAVEILEAIKLFLEAERCVFVVGVEQRIIEQGIRVKYHSLELENEDWKKELPASGNEYLEKIVQIPFYLPPLEQQHIADFARKRLTEKFRKPVAEVFAQGMEANPRKIKRVLNIFRLLWTLAEERGIAKEKDKEEGRIEADLLAKIVVIQSRWRDLYADVIKYLNLLGNLEDHFERMAQEAEAPPQPLPEQRDILHDEAVKYSVEDTVPDHPEHSPQKTLVEKYAGREALKELLLTPGASRFKGKDMNPYIYLTATVIEKREQEEREVSVDVRIWKDLTSNDPTRIEAAVGQIDDRQKGGYAKHLLTIISNQKTNNLNTRIAAGNALGMLGDPRLDALEMEMIPIPEGTFTMGTEGKGNESPQGEIYLDAFEIAKYPLTNFQYKAFLDANPDHREPEDWNNRTFLAGRANHPVVNISWEDARAYAEWLSQKTNKYYRLPTEAEREKAARGDQYPLEYPWGNEFDPSKCNTREGGPGDTTPVGIYPEGASFYKVMDMAGNVWEWCADRYDSDYYKKGGNRNPKGPKKGKGRVVRGGSWLIPRDGARCAVRVRAHPGRWDHDVGVRFSRAP